MSDTSDNAPPRAANDAPDPVVERSELPRKALKHYLDKLGRKLNALQTDQTEAQRGAEYRGFGETLLAYAHLVRRARPSASEACATRRPASRRSRPRSHSYAHNSRRVQRRTQRPGNAIRPNSRSSIRCSHSASP